MQFGRKSENGGFDFNKGLVDTRFTREFENEQEDYIFDLEPQSQNLFFLANFSESVKGTDDDSLKELYNAHMRCRSIELPRLTFDYETDELTKIPIFKSGKFNYEITINWLEDVYHSIYHYHENWMARWYNYQYNVLRCGQSGKFRKCQLVAYHYKKKNDVFNPDVEAEPLYIINIYGMVPRELPPIKHSYDEDQGDQTLSISYYCSKFEILFNSEFTRTNDSNFSTTGDAVKEKEGADAPSVIWGPGVGINKFSDGKKGDDTTTFEKLRISRAVTQRYGPSQLERT